MSRAAPVMFVDVDETIIKQKSLFALLRYASLLDPPLNESERERISEISKRLQHGTLSRQLANARYYQCVLRGRSVACLDAVARAWFADGMRTGAAFLDEQVASFLRAQQAHGFALVLVTGSFAELLAPLADHLGVVDILGAPLEVRDGRFTGRLLSAPTIGHGKAIAVSEYAAARRLDLSRCVAMGDDISDLDFLRRVGRVVLPPRADAQLKAWASLLGWPTLGTAQPHA